MKRIFFNTLIDKAPIEACVMTSNWSRVGIGTGGGGEDGCGCEGADVVRCLCGEVCGVGVARGRGDGRGADVVLGRGGGGGRVS